MKELINEFGEKISEKELKELSQRIRRLSDEEIDELWHSCEFIYTYREEKFKAITQEYINKIKESLESAEDIVWNLVAESHIDNVKQNLSKIEDSIKLIDTKEYKSFKTEFFILPKTQKFLAEKDIDIKDHLLDTFHWYEQVLFDLLDSKPGNDWSPEKETRKNFKVVFYGIIEKWIDKVPEGFTEKFSYNNSKILSDSYKKIHPKNKTPFAIREKILII